MSSKTEAAFALLDEIREMQQTVDYLQFRILRKHVAVAEIMNSLELDQDKAPTAEPQQEGPSAPVPVVLAPEVIGNQDGRQSYPHGERVNACKLVRQAVASMNGTIFYYKELADAAMKICPHADPTDIKKATYPVIKSLKAQGKVVRVPGGFTRALLAEPL